MSSASGFQVRLAQAVASTSTTKWRSATEPWSSTTAAARWAAWSPKDLGGVFGGFDAKSKSGAQSQWGVAIFLVDDASLLPCFCSTECSRVWLLFVNLEGAWPLKNQTSRVHLPIESIVLMKLNVKTWLVKCCQTWCGKQLLDFHQCRLNKRREGVTMVCLLLLCYLTTVQVYKKNGSAFYCNLENLFCGSLCTAPAH